MKKAKDAYFIISITVLIPAILGQLSFLKPGSLAPSFTLQTLDGRITYKKRHKNSTLSQHPIIFQAFTSRSAFLEALWTDPTSLENFLKQSPRNTQYVFFSFAENAKEDAEWMRRMLHRAVHKYYRYDFEVSSVTF